MEKGKGEKVWSEFLRSQIVTLENTRSQLDQFEMRRALMVTCYGRVASFTGLPRREHSHAVYGVGRIGS